MMRPRIHQSSAVLTLLLGSCVLACQPESIPADRASLASAGDQATPAFSLRIESQRVALQREVPATVLSLDHIAVAAEVEGRVLQVHAELGDRVTRGQKLASLDPSVLRSRFESAQASLELAESERGRLQQLVTERVASQRELDAANSVAKQARAAVQLAETALERTVVLSPVDGVVEARHVGPGDLAVPGRPLFSVYDPLRLALQAQIPLDDRAPIHLGTRLSYRLGGQEGYAAVGEIAPTSDPRSRTLRVRLSLESVPAEQLSKLTPGSFGVVRYPAGERQQLAIPAAAIQRVGQLEMVLVLGADGTWQRRSVRTGTRFPTTDLQAPQNANAPAVERVEILAGLAEGETIGWTP
jgi:RND family efflux transporter MFP subunit